MLVIHISKSTLVIITLLVVTFFGIGYLYAQTQQVQVNDPNIPFNPMSVLVVFAGSVLTSLVTVIIALWRWGIAQRDKYDTLNREHAQKIEAIHEEHKNDIKEITSANASKLEQLVRDSNSFISSCSQSIRDLIAKVR